MALLILFSYFALLNLITFRSFGASCSVAFASVTGTFSSITSDFVSAFVNKSVFSAVGVFLSGAILILLDLELSSAVVVFSFSATYSAADWRSMI